jgi:predicted alpha/beta-hydrolase family hydrolase
MHGRRLVADRLSATRGQHHQRVAAREDGAYGTLLEREEGGVAPDASETLQDGGNLGWLWHSSMVVEASPRRNMCTMKDMVSIEPFEFVPDGGPAVYGFLHRPAKPGGDGIILTHGAGSDSDAPLLVTLASAFAERSVAALRCDLPYRQARRRGPPSPATAERDRDGIRQAIRALRGIVRGAIFVGGHSYGGRQCSMVLAETPGLADALLLLSYPLHPPGRPADRRCAHLPSLRVPTLFVHGTTDPFGTIEEIEAGRALLPARTALLTVRAGHDLGQARARASLPALAERVVLSFLEVL